MKDKRIIGTLVCLFLCALFGTGIYLYKNQTKTVMVAVPEKEELFGKNDLDYLVWKIRTAYEEERIKELAQEIRERDQWKLLLVNFENSLGEEFDVSLKRVKNNEYVDKRIADPLMQMLNDALEEGIDICIVSGYRSYQRQTSLHNKKVRRLRRQGYTEEEARIEAATVVAVPGTSEHMTGLAVDLVTAENPQLEQFQKDSDCYKWLEEHCAEYGFIVRYPEGKSDITGIIYEPWHFRYVGVEYAEKIMENGWCLEEFLNYESSKWE